MGVAAVFLGRDYGCIVPTSSAASKPETVLMNVAQIELAHSYGMPALSVGFVPDASDLGFRSGLELTGAWASGSFTSAT